ncbi:MAG: histone deacetylase [Deltaproteobacteria bacterium]|nr:histone deacetylase [Deltaproteobacteria bacterium]MBW2413402.1 histone deacetylase [Deltaproteobacteria bacterium]
MSQPRPLLVRDPRFRDHAPPSQHPERPARLDAIDAALDGLLDRVGELEPREAQDDELLRAHDKRHLDALRRVEGERAQLDPDTYTSPHSVEVARLAAGATIDLARSVARGDAPSGFALVRPPGHHAESGRSMGFCLVNQVAVAARALQADGVERIAIVDWDVHHGNGTQEIFEADRDVLYLSLHQFPWYPGTGALGERGRGAGEGATVNLPLPAGCGDAEYGAVFDAVAVPVLREFAPEIVLVSAGFDAHARDPLSSMELSSQAFGRFAAQIRALADETCDGRVVLALEGGYDLEALGEAAAAVVQTLIEPETPDFIHPCGTDLSRQLVEICREAHSGTWSSLHHVSGITG